MSKHDSSFPSITLYFFEKSVRHIIAGYKLKETSKTINSTYASGPVPCMRSEFQKERKILQKSSSVGITTDTRLVKNLVTNNGRGLSLDVFFEIPFSPYKSIILMKFGSQDFRKTRGVSLRLGICSDRVMRKYR